MFRSMWTTSTPPSPSTPGLWASGRARTVPISASGAPGWTPAASQVHLIEAKPPDSRGQHFALHVEDLDGVVAELRNKGVEVSDPVMVGTGRQSFLRDPAGNQVELQQPAG
jgi:catechol 2,3-dioxygenase-like lactoylglutathione lyase family enzyme